MRTAIIILAVIGTLLCHGIVMAGGAPDLTGEWQVITSEWRSEKLGFNVDKPSSFKFLVTGQKRKIFWGKRTFWDQNTRSVRTVPFSGVICVNNNSVYIKEHGNGIAHGNLVERDKMYLYFMENDDNAKVILWEIVRME